MGSPSFVDVAPGRIAAVVTTLDMRTRPAGKTAAAERVLERHTTLPLAHYRDLYRRVGQDWLWFSRLALPDAALAAIIHDPQVEVWTLIHEGRAEGLLELDFRTPESCELAFFGLTDRMIGTGAGRWLMDRAIERAWAKPIARFWVHTCTLDHPSALAFYLRSGFTAVSREVEIADDPRLTGLVPRTAAPWLPLIESEARPE